MTSFDHIAEAIYDGSQISDAAIRRGVQDMGLAFPLMIVAAQEPKRKRGLPTGLVEQTYFWHLHPGLIYVLWHAPVADTSPFARRGWLCGEAQLCPHPERFLIGLQNAILSLRRQELESMLRHAPHSLSFSAELDTRRLALNRMRTAPDIGSNPDNADWKNALEVWLGIVLRRHQRHLNTVQRKMSEFFSLMTCEIETSVDVANCFQQVQREMLQTYSFGEVREKFPVLAMRLLQTFPRHQSLETRNLSPLSRQALAWLEAHYSEAVSIADCAASIPVSPAYLSRLLRKETGQTPVHYLQQKRIAHARLLLQESQSSIGEIAHSCGFGSTKHFYRVFIQQMGIAPATYRRNARRD